MDKSGQATAGTSGAAILNALEDLLVALRKSSKDLAFYPPGHPLLNRSLERSAEQLRAAVAARASLSLTVSRAGFSYEGQPVGKENQQLATMAAELFVRRIQKIFFAQQVGPDELGGFLRMITSDPKQLVQQGGPAKVLSALGVNRIQVNEFDFRLTSTPMAAEGRTGESGQPAAGESRKEPTRGSEAAQGKEQGGGLTPEALLAAMGSQKELTVAALIQWLEREGASGGMAGYEWAASRLEKAIDQASHDDRLQDFLAILRVFLRHRCDQHLKATLRARAEQAVEVVSGGNTVAYLIQNLRTEEGVSARDVSAILVALGPRAIPSLLAGLTAEQQEEARERLTASLVRFHEAVPHDLTLALQAMERDRACQLAPLFAEIGGEAGVALLNCLLKHRDAQVRAAAVREVGRFGELEAQRLVVQALRDPDLMVFKVAVDLAAAAKLKLATPVLLRLAGQPVLRGKPFTIRKAALGALGAMGETGIVPMLRGVLYTRTWFQRGAGDQLRQTVAQALLAMGRPEAREIVEAGAHSRRGDVRRACTAALRRTPGAEGGTAPPAP